MRVLVYVRAEIRGADKIKQAARREVEEDGHQFVGFVSTPAQAHAALYAELADKVAGRPEHLMDLADWALPLGGRRRTGAGVIAVPVVALAWLLRRARESPAMTGALVTGIAAVIAAPLLLNPGPGPDRDEPSRPPIAGPPAPPGASPTPSPGQSAEPTPTPESAPAPEPESEPSLAAPNSGEGSGSSEPGEAPGTGGETTPEPEPTPEDPGPQSEPEDPEPTPGSPDEPPSSPPADDDEDEEDEEGEEDGEQCLVDLETLGVRLRVCVG